jgi:hypothetical protein
MRHPFLLAALAVAAWLFTFAAQANAPAKDAPATYDVREFVCPIGGKAFKQDVGYFAFPLITMPDGSWLGDTEIGVQIPVCPDNGLVLVPDMTKMMGEGDRILYADYSAAERERLPALIADPAYRALAAEGRYAQAYWLATALGRPAYDRFFMLQRSTWATRDPAMRARLVARFVADAPALIDAYTQGEPIKRFHRMYVVNALRELGQFDEALALLDAIEGSGPPVPGQADPDNMFGPGEADEPLRLAIQQRDDGRFAAATLPQRMLNDICDENLAALYGPTKPATKAACKLRRDAAAKKAADFEGAMWLRNGPELDAECAATPPDKMRGDLKIACDFAQDDRDQLAANVLTEDGEKLAADCAATPDVKRNSPLGIGCMRLDYAIGNALGAQLAGDAAAYAIFCPGGRDNWLDDRSEIANEGCMQAGWKLKSAATAALVADPAKLDPMCARSDDHSDDIDFYEVLLAACSTLRLNRDSAAIARLATDAAAFDAACGRYAKTNGAGNDVFDLTEPQERCRNAYRLRENTRTRSEAEAKGFACFSDAIYSPERPRCVTKAEYDAEMAVGSDLSKSPLMDMSMFDEGSSLMQAAHVRAAAIIAAGKARGTYPKADLAATE